MIDRYIHLYILSLSVCLSVCLSLSLSLSLSQYEIGLKKPQCKAHKANHREVINAPDKSRRDRSCADPESFDRGVHFWQCFFFSCWGERRSKYHYKRAIIGPPAKRHLNGASLACRWWPNIVGMLDCFVCRVVLAVLYNGPYTTCRSMHEIHIFV